MLNMGWDSMLTLGTGGVFVSSAAMPWHDRWPLWLIAGPKSEK
jgi:hypothetical protein